jgi:hypothetical protein
MLDYYEELSISARQGWWRRTFILLAQRLFLANQVISLRMHLLYLIVVLGEGSI